MKIAIVTPASCGPVVYFHQTVDDALTLLSLWGMDNCCGPHSIFKLVRGKWVPFAAWLNEVR